MANKVIIVPAYNCENYIAETLISLLNQGEDLRLIEMVIVTDDYSTDKTIEIAKATWKSAIPLEIFEASENRGEYKNMNECIAKLPSNINWYLVMHADNIAKPGWIKALVDIADGSDERVGTISTSWDNLPENGVIVPGENRILNNPERIYGNKDTVNGTLLKGCWWHISSCITRVKCYRDLGGLPLGLRLKGDWDFMLRLLHNKWDIIYIPQSLMIYRVNPTGSSSLSFMRHSDIRETLQVFQKFNGSLSFFAIVSYYFSIFVILVRRFFASLLRHNLRRAFAIPAISIFVILSFVYSLRIKLFKSA